MLLTEKISLKSEPQCYSRDFIAELREKIYDLLFIRELGIIRARVWISALLWVVYFKGSSWTIISTGFWERIMLCSVIRKQHHRSIRFHLKFFHVFSKSRLPAKKALLYFFHQKSYHFYCYWRKLNPLDRKMIKLLTFDNLFPPLRHDEGFHGFRRNDAGSRARSARTCSQGFSLQALRPRSMKPLQQFFTPGILYTQSPKPRENELILSCRNLTDYTWLI